MKCEMEDTYNKYHAVLLHKGASIRFKCTCNHTSSLNHIRFRFPCFFTASTNFKRFTIIPNYHKCPNVLFLGHLSFGFLLSSCK